MSPSPRSRHLAAAALLAAAVPASLAAQSPVDTISTGPGMTAPAWSVGSSRVVIDSAEIATAAASTLTELLQTRAAGVSVLMTGGTLRESGTVRVRGVRSFAPAALPSFIVDGVRVDEEQDETFGPASRLDDVPLGDIARVEILRGAAAAALYGAEAGSGVIVVTTKRGEGAWRWRSRGESLLRRDVASYPTNYHRTGIATATGTPMSYCPLVVVGSGACTPTGLEQWNPLEAANPFRTGAEIGGGAEASGATATTSARLSVDSRRAEGIARDDEASRLGARLGVTRKVGHAIEARLTGALSSDWTVASHGGAIVGYGLTHMASPDSAVRFGEQVDSILASGAAHQRLQHGTLGLGVRWQALDWLAADVRASRDRIDSRAEQILTGVYFGTHMLGKEHRTFDDFRASLEAAHRAPFGASGSATLGTERYRRESGRELSYVYAGGSGGQGQGQYVKFHGDAWFAEERLAWNDRAGIGVGMRYELDEAVSAHRRLHPAVDGSLLLARSLAGAAVRARAAYGETANRADPEFLPLQFLGDRAPAAPLAQGYPYGGFVYPTPPPEAPVQKVRETEAGIDARWGRRGSISVTAYDAATHDARYVRYTLVGPMAVPARLRNRGFEVDGRLRALQWSGGRSWWEVRGVVSTLSARVTSGPSGASATWTGAAVAEGQPILGATERPYTWSDADGDGIIDYGEVATTPEQVRGPSLPELDAALHSTVGLADRLGIGVVLDRHAGFYTNDVERVRCGGSIVCRGGEDPVTSLAEQAQVVSRRYDASEMEDASFTRLRELWLRWRVPAGAAARIGAHDASVTLGARNVALWSHSHAPDPETSAISRRYVIRYPMGAQPLPRQLMVKLEIGYGGAR